MSETETPVAESAGHRLGKARQALTALQDRTRDRISVPRDIPSGGMLEVEKLPDFAIHDLVDIRRLLSAEHEVKQAEVDVHRERDAAADEPDYYVVLENLRRQREVLNSELKLVDALLWLEEARAELTVTEWAVEAASVRETISKAWS